MGVPLRYVDRSVRGTPWWRVHTVRHIDPDPNPIPHLRIWWWPRTRRRRRGS